MPRPREVENHSSNEHASEVARGNDQSFAAALSFAGAAFVRGEQDRDDFPACKESHHAVAELMEEDNHELDGLYQGGRPEVEDEAGQYHLEGQVADRKRAVLAGAQRARWGRIAIVGAFVGHLLLVASFQTAQSVSDAQIGRRNIQRTAR